IHLNVENILVVQRSLLHKYMLNVEIYFFNNVGDLFTLRENNFKINLVYLLRQHERIMRYLQFLKLYSIIILRIPSYIVLLVYQMNSEACKRTEMPVERGACK